MEESALPSIFEASLEELNRLLLPEEKGAGEPESVAACYAFAIRNFHRGNIAALESLLSLVRRKFSDSPDASFLESAISLRIAIRKREIPEETMAEADSLCGISSLWQGELALLLATCFSIRNRHEEASRWFRQSLEPLERIGCYKKALKARLNLITAKGHLENEANIIPEYFDLYRLARKEPYSEISVAAMALLCISKEYQRLGSLLAALKYCTQSLHLAEENFGSLQYFLALVHRAHLYWQLGRKAEMQIDCELAAAANMPEVQAALKVLSSLIEEKPLTLSPKEEEALIPAWKEKIPGPRPIPIRLSPQEDKLLRFLGSGKRARPDILDHLYGENLPFEVKLNRFKNLLGTLRRKSPHLVVCEEGHYRLADRIFQVNHGA